MASKKFPSRLPERTLDDGTLRVEGVHIGDGFYAMTCTCEVCGDQSTKRLTVRKEQAEAVTKTWFQEHHHNP